MSGSEPELRYEGGTCSFCGERYIYLWREDDGRMKCAKCIKTDWNNKKEKEKEEKA